jgi:hypothetical protein
MNVQAQVLRILALAFTIGPVSYAHALDLSSSAFYAGGGIGASWIDPETSGTIYSIGDDQDFAWHLLGGYRINRNFSVELAYTDLGKADLQIASTGASAGEASYRQTTLGLLWSPTMQSGYTWRPYLKGGVNYSDHSWDQGTLDTQDWNAFGGIGIEKFFGSNDFSLRAEFTVYSQDAQALNISFVKYFGN